MISLILACNSNGTIGQSGSIPWMLKDDTAHFKNMTVGQNVLMGRKTYESLGCKPLPNRNNYVITSSNYIHKHMKHENVNFIRSYDELPEDFFVIGGKCLYEDFITHADFVYLTAVNNNFLGDTVLNRTFFTCLKNYFLCTDIKYHNANERNTHDFSIHSYCKSVI